MPMIAGACFSDPLSPIIPLFTSLLAAAGFIYYKCGKARKRKLSLILRVLFDKKKWLSRSSLLDFQYVVAGKFVFSFALVYTAFTGSQISDFAYAQLTHTLGASDTAPNAVAFYSGASILLLYLVYEFAYWLDHMLCHKLPFLWEFHRVHHSATTLTPFTNWRVHPVDTMIFANIVAIMVGTSHGLVHYVWGEKVAADAIAGSSVLIFIYMTLYGHLQHTRLWIPFNGLTGRILLSPAHHQIHHSREIAHFDKNFGAALSLFDWIFGTLHMPTEKDKALRVGVDHLSSPSLIGSIAYPFASSAAHIARYTGLMRKKNPVSSSGAH